MKFLNLLIKFPRATTAASKLTKRKFQFKKITNSALKIQLELENEQLYRKINNARAFKTTNGRKPNENMHSNPIYYFSRP